MLCLVFTMHAGLFITAKQLHFGLICPDMQICKGKLCCHVLFKDRRLLSSYYFTLNIISPLCPVLIILQLIPRLFLPVVIIFSCPSVPICVLLCNQATVFI